MDDNKEQFVERRGIDNDRFARIEAKLDKIDEHLMKVPLLNEQYKGLERRIDQLETQNHELREMVADNNTSLARIGAFFTAAGAIAAILFNNVVDWLKT